jgi:hypothetical protein
LHLSGEKCPIQKDFTHRWGLFEERKVAPREQLTPQEYAALRHPQGNQKLLRHACLKIARFLSFYPS